MVAVFCPELRSVTYATIEFLRFGISIQDAFENPPQDERRSMKGTI